MALLCRDCGQYYNPSDPSKIIGCDCPGSVKARADRLHEQVMSVTTRLHVSGISRVVDNEKVLMLSFDRQPSDREMRQIHELLRSAY